MSQFTRHMTQIIHPYKLDVPNRDNFPRFTPKYTDSNSVCLVKFSCETLFITYTCPNHYEQLKIRSNLNGPFCDTFSYWCFNLIFSFILHWKCIRLLCLQKIKKKICSVGQIDIIYQVSLKNERFLTTKWRKTKHLVCSLASPSTDCDNENVL